MSSKVEFNNIISFFIKPVEKVTDSERKAGKLQAGSITNKLINGTVIDAFILNKQIQDICGDAVTFNEEDIEEGSRKQFFSLSELYIRKGRLPVHTDFFKKLKHDSNIVVILHGIK